jgi:DNA-binding NtrC family response regulator
MNVLLSFTGFHDPYFKGLVGEEEQPGPILSLLSARSFHRVCLFSTPGTERVTVQTREAISILHSATTVHVLDVALDDPTDYGAILRGLREHICTIQEQSPSETRFYVAVASGTPQMHACWVLLAAAGEIPATILHVRPPRFVTKDRSLVTEVDLSSPEFPIVRAHVASGMDLNGGPKDLEAVVAQIGIVGDHPRMRQVVEMGAMLAPSNAPVLVLGETGTGKELFARLIHRLSGRHTGRFVTVNCAAVPEGLTESVLFGHKKGAFTGAISDQLGKFDLADKGTLFLDEIGDLPLASQAKLLRVLQDSIIEPLGGNKPHEVDIRVIVATNRDLRKQIREGKFREDLYYRLSVGEVVLPPLRDRRSDIPKLALHILDGINASLRRPKRLSSEAMARLQGHDWPGNVRDLENVLERSTRLSRNELLAADDLLIGEPVTRSDLLNSLPHPHEGFSMEEFLGSARKQLILRAMEASRGNQSEAARLLGISPQAVHKFLQTSKARFNPG